MFVLRLIGKILLLPVWLILGISWLAVHIVVEIFGIFHGLWKTFFTVFIILFAAFGMWQNVIVTILFIAATFLILLAGSFVEALIAQTLECVGNRILGIDSKYL